jgi:hypothetical protein
MSRNAVESHVEQHVVTEEDAKGLPAMLEDAQQLTVAQAAVLNAEEALKVVGRIEAAEFMATVSEKMIVESAIALKQSKQYKGLPYKDADGNWRQVATFEEFCQHKLGKSRRRIDELVSNYSMLGSDLFEQAEKIGFRQRDYNALKALPSDDRLLIAQAIEEENLEKALDILQEMAAKHFRDKEAMTKQCDELTKTLEARETVIKDKAQEIFGKDEKIALLENEKKRKALEPVSPEQALLDARSNLQITAVSIKMDVASRMMQQVKALVALDPSQRQYAAAMVIEVQTELEILIGDFGLPTVVDDNPVPEWMRGTEFDPHQAGA